MYYNITHFTQYVTAKTPIHIKIPAVNEQTAITIVYTENIPLLGLGFVNVDCTPLPLQKVTSSITMSLLRARLLKDSDDSLNILSAILVAVCSPLSLEYTIVELKIPILDLSWGQWIVVLLKSTSLMSQSHIFPIKFDMSRMIASINSYMYIGFRTNYIKNLTGSFL